MTSTFKSCPDAEEQYPAHIGDEHHDQRQQQRQRAPRLGLDLGRALVDLACQLQIGACVVDQLALLGKRLSLQRERLLLHRQRVALQRVGFFEQLFDATFAHSKTALWYTACVSSRSSSTSSSFCMRCESSPASSIAFSARHVTSARSGFKPALCSACCTGSKSAGAHSTSTAPSSPAITSSAPASSATSINLSSLVPGANTNWPQCLNWN